MAETWAVAYATTRARRDRNATARAGCIQKPAEAAERLAALVTGLWVIAVGLALAGPAAIAAEWVERPFHPVVGSRWIIQSQETEEDKAGSTVVGTSTKKITALLTFEEKLTDGYRITYRRTDSSYEGDADDPVTARAALAAMQGHTFRAVTDLAGKPLRVENLPELRAALRKAIDDVAATAASPEITAAIKKMMADFADIDDKRAAEKNLDDVPAMALGQNTGLKIGEVRRQTVTEPLPGASPLLKTASLTLVEAAPDGAKARFEAVEVTDPESMRAMLLSYLGKLDASDGGVREQIDLIKKMQFAQEQKTGIEVTAGMTRTLDIAMTTSKHIPGEADVLITNHRVVTISPAP
jgi:hypothetical protein